MSGTSPFYTNIEEEIGSSDNWQLRNITSFVDLFISESNFYGGRVSYLNIFFLFVYRSIYFQQTVRSLLTLGLVL